jgi:pantetheine-phosphate adenylyltransferase
MINEALSLFERLTIVVAKSGTKSGFFTQKERVGIIHNALIDLGVHDLSGHVIDVIATTDELTVDTAKAVGATFIVRGIRSATDLDYENIFTQTSKRINPEIKIIHLLPPPELSSYSSSVVRGLIGFKGWEAAMAPYIAKSTLWAIQEKLNPKL